MKYYSYLRTNCLAPEYVDIAAKNFVQAKDLLEQFDEYIMAHSSKADYFDYSDIFRHIISTIVFSALAVESFINDYACKIVGDDFFYDNFQSLSTISKLQLCHKIITGIPIDTGNSVCYSLLKRLTALRNTFVHNKSEQGVGMLEEDFLAYSKAPETEFIDEILYTDELIHTFIDLKKELNDAYDALRAVFELGKLIDTIDDTAHTEGYFFGNSFGCGFSEQVIAVRKMLHSSQKPPILRKRVRISDEMHN